MPDLSVLIPARQEMFLNRTVQDVLEHSTADTEVIVVLDGAWPETPLEKHDRVQVVYVPQSIGQRAATNFAARISHARYICKLDAHCSVAQGWDTELITAAQTLPRETVQIPAQLNLHAFDWVCQCGARRYQGPTPTGCERCTTPTWTREMIWKPRRGVRTTAWRFDRDLKFQYWGDFNRRPEAQGDLTPTLSCLGACWFLDREWFWELGGLDISHGSWGQMGTELACKAWLSGGQMLCNRRTMFAHLFRTQGGDFGFPYPLSGHDVDKARRHSRRLWLEGTWPQAKRTLSSLIEQFAPVPDWDSAPAIKTLTKGCVYYSDCRGDERILSAVRDQLQRVAPGPIVSVTLQPLDFGRNIHLQAERSYLTMFRQILAGLEAIDTDYVFLTEHDVLYHASHFLFTPPRNDVYYYNLNVWKVDAGTGRAVQYRAKQTSGLCAHRLLLLDHYRRRVDKVQRDGFTRRIGFEPGSHHRPERIDDHGSDTWWSEVPNVDIRHGHNLTPSRWSPAQFRDQKNCQGWIEADAVPGWSGLTRGRFDAWLADQLPAHVLVAQ